MSEDEKKESTTEETSASPRRDPQKRVHTPSKDTPGGAATESKEGYVSVGDMDTAVRVPGGGVRTNPSAAAKNKMPDEAGKPATVTQKMRGSQEEGEESAEDAKPKTPAAKASKKGGDGGEDRPWHAAVTRRSWLAGAWAAFAAALGIGSLATVRFLYPNVLFEPPLKFKVGYPKDFQLGVSNQFKNDYGVWVIKEETGFYALLSVCTHLGCTPNWLEADQKFKCPCHGSGFYKSGINFEGPAPRPLERVAISLADDGQILIDKGITFQEEKGEWSDPRAYLAVSA